MQWLLPIFLLPCLEVNHIKNFNSIWVILYACLVWLHWQRRLKVTYLESWIVVRIFNALECSLIFVAARNFSVLWHFYYAKNSKVFFILHMEHMIWLVCSLTQGFMDREYFERGPGRNRPWISDGLPETKLNMIDLWISQFDERARSRLWIIWNESAENKILKSQNPSIFSIWDSRTFRSKPFETDWTDFL